MSFRSRLAARLTCLCAVTLGTYSAASRAQTGWIDGGYWSNGQYMVVGWACDWGLYGSVWVMAYDENGDLLSSTLADQPSEPAVADACGAPGGSNFRFAIPVPAASEEMAAGQTIWVLAASNQYDYEGYYLYAWIANSGNMSYPDNRITGYIDSVTYGGGVVTVSGWACARGVAQSTSVHVYVGGPAGSGTFFGAASANLASESAVAQACSVPYGAYRYSAVIPFGPTLMAQLGGQRVYVHGISPIGGSNLLLNNSGAFALAGYTYSTYNSGTCGCINAQWDAPTGSLVLINSGGNSLIKPIIQSLGETYTHEMVSQGPGFAAQSEYAGPAEVENCDYPLDPNTLEFGYPGMEKSMDSGAIYADIYGSGLPFQVGTNNVIWQLGDTTRATLIAGALAVQPVVLVHDPFRTVQRLLWHGAPSPYGFYQFMNIEGTYLGESGTSTNNTSVSSTFCAWAYALGGTPMTPYDYSHQTTVNAANNFWQAIYNRCRDGLPFIVKSGFSTLFDQSCQSSIICNNAAAMVLNCMARGGDYCRYNNNFYWQSALTPPDSHAKSISPDRLGGLTHFLGENPRPTTWAADVTHPLMWNYGGTVCGCFE